MSLYPRSTSHHSTKAGSSTPSDKRRSLSPYRDTDSDSPSDNLGESPVHISREASPLAGLPDPNEFAITPETPYRKHGSFPSRPAGGGAAGPSHDNDDDAYDGQGWEDTHNDATRAMSTDSRRPPARSGDGKSHTPLLSSKDKSQDYSHSPRPLLPRRSTSRFHERDPVDAASKATRKRYTYASFFLVLSLFSFCIQTETAVYIQHYLHWNKAYCMLYLTHGSWSLLWPTQLLILRLQKWNMPWRTFWRRHVQIVRSTAQMVEHRTLHVSPSLASRSPVPYFIRTTAFVTCALTIAGGSWYVAVDLTTPSDLTAIYNCSAFFAYAFAIPLLGEKLKWSKVAAVLVAIIGVLVVAYGDAASTPKHGSKSGGGSDSAPNKEASNRALGNIVIGIGSVLYGFYEVLYKKVACPPDGCSPGRGMIFANTVGSMIGTFTLCVLWVPIPLLHWLGWETFELPRGEAAWMLLISVLANATFSGSFLILISLTSPVLSSVAALLTIFIVAIADQVLPPPLYNKLSAAAIAGGLLIIVAFVVLSWATYREMDEERRLKEERDEVEESDVEDL